MQRLDFPEQGAALVIGGSGGIGAAVCVALARAGSHVALTYRTNRDAAERVRDDAKALGRDAESWALDTGDVPAVRRVVEEAARRHGGLHTLVVAAGPDLAMRFISKVESAAFRRVMDADVNGFFEVAQASLPHLRRGRGSIVSVSTAGMLRWPTRDVLSVAPKAAIHALVVGIAREEGRFGVRANTVALGVIEAGVFERLTRGELGPEWVEAARRNTPLGRFGTATEVADTITWLASARASYVTGQLIALDGGYSL